MKRFRHTKNNMIIGIGNEWALSTGKVDKHGTEIFEGDRVKAGNRIGQIVWVNEAAAFALVYENGDMEDLAYTEPYEWEIIKEDK